MSTIGTSWGSLAWTGVKGAGVKKQPEQLKPTDEGFRQAMDVVSQVQGKIEDVAQLSGTKHNKSLDKDQVVLSGYRSGIKHAAAAVGNLLVNIWSFSALGTTVPQGTDAVLRKDDKGTAVSFDARDTASKNGMQKHSYTTDYFKKTGEDGSTFYSVVKSTDGWEEKKTSVLVSANGAIAILEND